MHDRTSTVGFSFAVARLALAVALAVLSADCLAQAKKAKPPPARKGGRKPSSPFQSIEDLPNLPRALLIGDSISIGYTLPTRALLKGKVDLHRIPTNGGPTVKGLSELDKWLGKEKWDVIHFNWGLHDLKYMNAKGGLAAPSKGKQQVPPAQYEKNLIELVTRLKKTGAKLIFATTTPVPEGSGGRIKGDAAKYNAIAVKVMKARGVTVNDLYAFILPKLKTCQRPRNVHFLPQGSQALASEVAANILAALGIRSTKASPAEVDLASDKAWTLRIDGGPARAIKVPGGGWNSDYQNPRIPTMEGVKDHVIYEREVAVPRVAAGQVTKILFTAVNYGAEVYIDNRLVTSHAGPQVPFAADVTGFVTPGQTHKLRVKAYHRRHYHGKDGKAKSCSVPVGFDFPKGAKQWSRWAGSTKFAYGITGGVKLVVFPPVYIKDIFVRPSVTDDTLTVWAWIHNSTDKRIKAVLAGRLSSWNQDAWKYPAIPKASCDVAPGATAKVVLGPVKWRLGPKSYWWPNIPFREDYKARLHYIDLTLLSGQARLHHRRRRFGFVQWGEGKHYYTVNGVRVNMYSDSTTESQMSYWDCYSTAPAFLPPDPKTGRLGCPETWKRYMRIGINMNRICCSTPTEYMMQTADEVGFMLMPESPLWGNHTSVFNPKVTPQVVKEMVRHCRSHPSVARYSVANEVQRIKPNGWYKLIDAVREADDTRPMSFDRQSHPPGKYVGEKGGHAYIMQHYMPIVDATSMIHGMGECCWGTDEMAQFAFAARQMRMKDWAYFSPWSWINYWPNFLEGMDHARHAWRVNNGPDRASGVNGWGSPVVKFVQKSLHPYLLIDHELRAKQAPIRAGTSYRVAGLGRRKIGDGTIEWPGYVPAYRKSDLIERKIEVFNGGLFGDEISLRWSARWDSPEGPVAVKGKTIGPFIVKPGFHTTQTVSFAAPDQGKGERKLYLVLESIKDGKVVFVEDAIYFNVTASRPAGTSSASPTSKVAAFKKPLDLGPGGS